MTQKIFYYQNFSDLFQSFDISNTINTLWRQNSSTTWSGGHDKLGHYIWQKITRILSTHTTIFGETPGNLNFGWKNITNDLEKISLFVIPLRNQIETCFLMIHIIQLLNSFQKSLLLQNINIVIEKFQLNMVRRR